jgi:hypothetical protein
LPRAAAVLAAWLTVKALITPVAFAANVPAASSALPVAAPPTTASTEFSIEKLLSDAIAYVTGMLSSSWSRMSVFCVSNEVI